MRGWFILNDKLNKFLNNFLFLKNFFIISVSHNQIEEKKEKMKKKKLGTKAVAVC